MAGLHFTCPNKNFEGKYFCEKIISQSISVSERRCFGLLWKIIQRGHPNCILLVPRNRYRNTVCLKNAYIFDNQFQTLSKKGSAVWQTFFDRIVKTAFCFFIETDQVKVVYIKKLFLYSVGDSAQKNFGNLSLSCWQGSQNSIFLFTKERFENKIVMNFFQSFLAFVRKISGSLSKNIQWGRLNCLLLVHRNLWWKTVCLKKVQTVQQFCFEI